MKTIGTMKYLSNLFAAIILSVPLHVWGQQEAMFGQYIFNNSVISPAQAGANHENQWGAIARSQWIGIDGAPRTESIYANLRLPRQIGLAFGLYQDRLGPEKNLHFMTDVAYHARLTEDWRLAGGIRLIMSNFRMNYTDIPNIQPGDPFFQEDLTSGLLINVGAGLLAYNGTYYFGISTPRAFGSHLEVLDSQIGDGNPNVNIKDIVSRHYFAYAGANYILSDETTFLPSVLVRHVIDAPLQTDLNAIFGYRNMLEAGVFLRSNLVEKHNRVDAIGLLIGIRFLPNWHFGYLYEYPVSDIKLGSRQTHEVSLRFLLEPRHDRVVIHPRFFL